MVKNGETYSFDPAAAGVEFIQLILRNNGCTNFANDIVEVFALPTGQLLHMTLVLTADQANANYQWYECPNISNRRNE
jgi:hypothetical protein